MRIHSALKHQNVLEFLNAVVVEIKHKHLYVPGIYMLLELAAGGDLFDKIGKAPQTPTTYHSNSENQTPLSSPRRRRRR